MDYPLGHIRVIAVAVGVVVDEQGRFLLIQHPHRHHLWFPSGHIKVLDKNGDLVDIERVCDAIAAGKFVGQLTRMKREHRRRATRREVYEELAEEMVPPIVSPILSHRARREQIKFDRDLDIIKLFNKRGDGTGYDKPITTETVIFPSLTTLPDSWMTALQTAAHTDRRVCFATKAEIFSHWSTNGPRRISPNVLDVLLQTGALEV